MNTVSLQLYKYPNNYYSLIFNVTRILQRYSPAISKKSTTVDPIDAFTVDIVQRHAARNSLSNTGFKIKDLGLRYFMQSRRIQDADLKHITVAEAEKLITDTVPNNKNEDIAYIMTELTKHKKPINKHLLHKLLTKYSANGNVEMVKLLQNYCLVTMLDMFYRNGEYLHYLAKAECMKGNSEKGLSILKDCYRTNKVLRSLYRIVFRELIHDSVLNRSEATMVIFKRHVLEYSREFNDHYPIICLWHICWISTWFSDQLSALDLLEASEQLRTIVQEKATTFSLNILKNEYNDDAVVRLLQVLLKYKMMEEYTGVLQILFTYKLRNHDMRGCTEILKNCETLGITLSGYHQGQFIKKLIEGPDGPNAKRKSKTFKFKF